MSACIVLVTCASKEEAEHISETIVSEQLVACVNLVTTHSSIRSFYIWEGKLQNEEEQLLIIKTLVQTLPALEARIQELHSYTVPEFIALPIIYGSENYIQWMSQSVKCIKNSCSLESIKE